jgi:hypothetical protein
MIYEDFGRIRSGKKRRILVEPGENSWLFEVGLGILSRHSGYGEISVALCFFRGCRIRFG